MKIMIKHATSEKRFCSNVCIPAIVEKEKGFAWDSNEILLWFFYDIMHALLEKGLSSW